MNKEPIIVSSVLRANPNDLELDEKHRIINYCTKQDINNCASYCYEKENNITLAYQLVKEMSVTQKLTMIKKAKKKDVNSLLYCCCYSGCRHERGVSMYITMLNLVKSLEDKINS